MSLPRTLRVLAAGALVAVALPAHAQQCDVFTDVLASASYCGSVQWLKNRSITTGCTTTTYCPDANVTRAQMALFMSRLGLALTPQLIGRQDVMAATNLAPGLFNAFCFGSPLAAVNYPRTARARGTINVPASGPQLDMFLVLTLNGQPYTNINSLANTVVSPNGTVNLSWSSSTVSVPPGSTAGFAVGLSNPAPAGTLVLGSGTCAIEVDVVNANPTSPPFDN